MLHTPADFPHPGSIAEFDGKRWRILQLLPGGEVLLGAQGTGASFTRRAPLAALIDPDADTPNLDNLSAAQAKTLRWLNARLRTANRLLFDDLKTEVYAAVLRGEACAVDGFGLAALLRRLGWQREPRHAGQSERIRIWKRGETAQGAA